MLVLSERVLWWGTFAVCAALGLVWAFSTPIMAAPDESAHTLKAVAMADGQWTMSTTSRTEPDGRIAPITHVDVPRGLVELGIAANCFNGHAAVPAKCASADGSSTEPVPWDTYVATCVHAAAPVDCPTANGSSTEQVTWDTYVAAYPPTYYLLVGWPSRLLGPEVAYYAMRACSVALAAALLAGGLASARAFRREPSRSGSRRVAGVAVAGAALAITPIAMFLAGSINPNGLEIAAAFCVWLSALELFGGRRRPSTRLVVKVVLSAALLAGSRPLSPVMLACVLAFVVVVAIDRPTWRRLAADHRMRWAAAVLAVVVAASAMLVALAHSLSSVIRSPLGPDVTRGTILRRTLEGWRFPAEQLVGVLGTLDVKLPSTLVLGWFAMVLALVALAWAWSTWRPRVVLVVLIAACLLMPTVAEVASGPTYGVGWQGRYTMPLAVGVPIVAGWLIDRWGPRSSRLATTLVVVGVVGAALGQARALLALLNRYSMGAPTSRFGLRSAVDWRGPLQPLVLLGLGVVAATAWAGWLLLLALRPVTPAPEVSESS